MKLFTQLSLTLIFLTSCGGDSKAPQAFQVKPTNFSIQKFNEDLIGKFYLTEMNTSLNSLSSISKLTSSCFEGFQKDKIKTEWETLALSYQRLWPLNHVTLDRDPEVGYEKASRYLSGPFSYSACALQIGVAKQKFSKSSLNQSPAINSLEFLSYSGLLNKNFCRGKDAETIDQWLASTDKENDLCAQIHRVSKLTHLELTEIKNENQKFFESGKTSSLLSDKNLQKAYDSIAIFTDQILKDEKTAQPLGLSETLCPFKDRTCPNSVEHKLSNISFEALSKNLEGLMAVYNQNTEMLSNPLNKGFYQFLLANNQSKLALSLYSNILEAHKLSTALHGESFFEMASLINSAEGKEACRQSSPQNKLVPACSLYKSIKSLSDKVKLDLRIALALSKTRQIEGDSD